MIYILYTNNDKIEGKGTNVIVGISTDFEFLKKLAYDIPCSMNCRYPNADIYAYEDSSKIKKDQSKTSEYIPTQSYIQHWYLSCMNGQWYDNFEDYINAR